MRESTTDFSRWLTPQEKRHRDEYLRNAAAYRSELKALSDDQLNEMLPVEQAKRQAADAAQKETEERARFYNATDAQADLAYWAKHAYWSLEEAVALTFARNPDRVSWQRLAGYDGAFTERYRRLRQLGSRAVIAKKLRDPTLPALYLTWLRTTGFEAPPALVLEVSKTAEHLVDWKARYDIASTRISDLERELDSLRAELASLKPSRAAKAADSRERESMLKLIAGLVQGTYGSDIAAGRSRIVPDIAADCDRAGVSLSEDTIRKYVKWAFDLRDQQAVDPADRR